MVWLRGTRLEQDWFSGFHLDICDRFPREFCSNCKVDLSVRGWYHCYSWWLEGTTTLEWTFKKVVWDKNSREVEIFFGNSSVPLEERHFHISTKILILYLFWRSLVTSKSWKKNIVAQSSAVVKFQAMAQVIW